MKSLKKLMLMALGCMLVIGCTKDPVEPDTPILPGDDSDSTAFVDKAWVLNEGTWSKNNAGVSFLDVKQGAIDNNCFKEQNGRGLGDVAQDLIVYGSKLYVTVWNSNTVEVINAKTGKSIKQISFASKGPREFAVSGGKVYVSCYDETVVRIDTVSLEIDGTCAVDGFRPEGMCVLGDKLYVTHSWRPAENGASIYDSTLSVVDIPTFTEERKLNVGVNPFSLIAYDDNHIIVGYWGDQQYRSEKVSGIELLDVNSGECRMLKEGGISKFDYYQDYVYGFDFSYATYEMTFWKVNVTTGEETEILQNRGVKMKTPYGIKVNPKNGDIYVTDSQEFRSKGDVHCFSATGEHKWSVEAGMGPSKIVLL